MLTAEAQPLASMAKVKLILSLTTPAATISGCSNDDTDKPYLEFVGGEFIDNYRLATADYGFVVRTVKKVPAGSIIEAEFKNPSGGPPIVPRQIARSTRLTYKFQTPPVNGIKANTDYRAEVRLIGPGNDKVFARYEKLFHAEVDRDIFPKMPPVVGPGYLPNPEAK